MYTNKQIDIFYLYSWFFTNYLVYMTYCGSMPFMYILGLIHFILAYWCYKYLFFRFNRKAFGFDEAIPMYTMRLMKYGILLHLIFNIFMFTNKRLMVPEKYDTIMHYRALNISLGVFFARRFDQLAYLAVLFVFIIILAVYFIFECIVKPCYRCASEEMRKRK